MPVFRIALLTGSTRPRGAVPTLALAEALARVGHEVSVWALTRSGDTGFSRPVDPAVRLHAVPFPEIENEGAAARVQRAVAVLSAAFAEAAAGSPAGFDVVLTQDCISANAVPGRIRTVRRLDHVAAPELLPWHERALLEPCAHVCVSASVAAELAEVWGRSAVVIPDGVDAARFAAAAGDDPGAVEQRRYWTDRFGDFVLAVGGIAPRKGTLELVRAMARVRRRRPGTRLVIAGGDTPPGDPDYRREVDALAVRLRIDPEVLEPVEHEQLPSLMAAAGAFAFASVQPGSTLAALEALAAGVPVVARDLPALGQVFGDVVRFADVGDGSSADVAAGLAVQLVAALEGSTGESVRSTREAGQALADRHSWDHAASAQLAFFRELIDAGRPVGFPG